ncbi:MAG TPA: hypothetical protein VMH89_08010 [Candidatus Acidoferrum sp.]|nr:hypothetical protein [Candidatus Acidoferrum sp.]
MTLKTKSGIALVLLGFAIFAAWTGWKRTRNFIPVITPISLVANQTTTNNFTLNFDALYQIGIEAEKSLPPAILRCRMAIEENPANCKDAPSALAISWTLSSSGQKLKSGNSDDQPKISTDSDKLVRILGEFQGRAGQEYTIQLTSNADGASLASANPHLKIAVATIAFTDLQSAGVLVFSMAFICVLFGMILLAIALHASRASTRRTN